jgi:lipopolysaccharide transport protein LptA
MCGSTIYYALFGQYDKTEKLAQGTKEIKTLSKEGEESYFKKVSYYLLNQNARTLELKASSLALSNENKKIISFDPDGVIYRRDNSGKELLPIYFSAKNSRADSAKREVVLQNEVKVISDNSQLFSDNMVIYDNGKILDAKGNVKTLSNDQNTNDKILVNAEEAIYKPDTQFFEYQKNVDGIVQRKRAYEESLSFKTDKLTISGLDKTATMTGNVAFKKDKLEAFSNNGSMYLENYNKKLKYYALSDDVRLQETLIIGNKQVLRKAFAEKLEGFISDKRVVLTGFPKVFQGTDVIKGNRITIRENIETVEVDDANTNISLEKN